MFNKLIYLFSKDRRKILSRLQQLERKGLSVADIEESLTKMRRGKPEKAKPKPAAQKAAAPVERAPLLGSVKLRKEKPYWLKLFIESMPGERSAVARPVNGDVIVLDKSDLHFIPVSVDSVGRVCRWNNRVFRTIRADLFEDYRSLLESEAFADLFKKGLVDTWIPQDVKSGIEGYELIEHEVIPHFLNPSEMTDRMAWEICWTFLQLNRSLSELGWYLKDSHPFNMTYRNGLPVFFDFGSLDRKPHPFGADAWVTEFIFGMAMPVWLAATSDLGSTAVELRKNLRGFGYRLLSTPNVMEHFSSAPKAGVGPFKVGESSPEFFDGLLEWLLEHLPQDSPVGRWSGYNNNPARVEDDESAKHRFFRDSFNKLQPASVVDLGANKGEFAILATKMGATAAALEYESLCVDLTLDAVRSGQLPVTPAMANFAKPCPPHGCGLLIPSVFERFNSDLVLALGLIHHVCITQRIPVEVFCHTCKQYARKGVALEMVGPDDKHVASWKQTIPADYNIEAIAKMMADKFPNMDVGPVVTANGVNRRFYLFY